MSKLFIKTYAKTLLATAAWLTVIFAPPVVMTALGLYYCTLVYYVLLWLALLAGSTYAQIRKDKEQLHT